MLIVLAYQDFSETFLREVFPVDYTYDSANVYERLRYDGFADTARIYAYADFFGLRLVRVVKEYKISKYFK